MNREEIAQWAIDNRYPKSEQEKIGDAEMYQTIIEQLADLIEQEKKAEVIAYMDYCFNLGVRAETAERWYEQFKEATK